MIGWIYSDSVLINIDDIVKVLKMERWIYKVLFLLLVMICLL